MLLAKGADISRRKRQGSGVQHPGARAQPFFFPTVRARKKSLKSRAVRNASFTVNWPR